jgi:D-alanine transaminase
MNSKEIVFLNDDYIDYDKAFIHIEDRGFQLGDGIYEVILFENNKLIDFENHIDRLFSSAQKIDLKINKTIAEFKEIFLELLRKNNQKIGAIYIQITRGQGRRIQNIPNDYQETINIITKPYRVIEKSQLENGFSAITHEDIRWGRCDIKSISLLANTTLKEKAHSQGHAETILIKDDIVTEGSFSNVFIVNNDDEIITKNSDNRILTGITRNRIIKLAQKNNLKIIEKEFSKEDLLNAREVFVTSSTLKIRPINKIDNIIIGSGKAGEITKKLIKIYNDFVNQ